MNWLGIALTVMGCIVKYGPELWRLGIAIYKIVDEIVTKFKNDNPKATKEEVKALADTTFDVKLVEVARNSAMRVPGPATRVQLRRDVWSTRPENYQKIKTGIIGMRPH